MPETGDFHVSLIEIKTPFILVLERPMQVTSYSAPQAEEEFLGKPGMLAVHADIFFSSWHENRIKTTKHGFEPVPGPSWRDFKFHLTQE